MKNREIAKLNKRLVDLISAGKKVEIGMIDRDRYYISADGREAVIFSRSECWLDLNKLMAACGTVPVIFLPEERRPVSMFEV